MDVPLLWLVAMTGQEGRIVVLLTDEHEGFMRSGRQALAVEELSDAEIEAISRAEPPAEAAQYDQELAVRHGADS